MYLARQLGAWVDNAQRAVGYLVRIGSASLDEPRLPQRDQTGHRGVVAAQRLGQGDRTLERPLPLQGGIAVPGSEWRRNGFEDFQLLTVTVAASGQVADDRQGFPVQPDGFLVGVPVLGPGPRGGEVRN